jgi:predicted  nucleic acid-binding Zn-ribbon protein
MIRQQKDSVKRLEDELKRMNALIQDLNERLKSVRKASYHGMQRLKEDCQASHKSIDGRIHEHEERLDAIVFDNALSMFNKQI